MIYKRVDNQHKTCGINSMSTSIDVNHAMHDAIVQNQLKKNYHRQTPVEKKRVRLLKIHPESKLKSNREEKIPRYNEREKWRQRRRFNQENVKSEDQRKYRTKILKNVLHEREESGRMQ